jgi:soluble lytic murein transglycosylase-like protein
MKTPLLAVCLAVVPAVVYLNTPIFNHLAVVPTIEVLRAVNLEIHAPSFTLSQVVRAVSKKRGISESFIKSIIAAESGFHPEALSPRGAIGLMQLMPATAREYGATNPHLPEQNIDAGTSYLSWLMVRYRKRKDQMVRTIAAYNAGPGMVDRYHGVPPFRETRDYVVRVMRYFNQYEGVPAPRMRLARARLLHRIRA